MRFIARARGRRARRAAILAVFQAERARYGDEVARYRAMVRARRTSQDGKQ